MHEKRIHLQINITIFCTVVFHTVLGSLLWKCNRLVVRSVTTVFQLVYSSKI